MYKQLNNYEKFIYFSNNTLVKIICKNLKIKTVFSVYILTPLIKINYLIITTLIYLLCALCDKQLDDILLKNGFNNFSNTNDYDESPIINFTENSELQKLNEKINSSIDSPTSLKTDVDFFMNTLQNVQDNISPKIILSPNNIQENISPKNIQENIFLLKDTNKDINKDINKDTNKDIKIKDIDKLNKIIDFKIVTSDTDEEKKDSNNYDNDSLNDFLIEEINNDIENEEFKDFIINKEEEKKIYESNELNQINEINENNENNETISIEEVDFGDYVNNLINKNFENSENKVINSTVPTKIKIGKKRK